MLRARQIHFSHGRYQILYGIDLHARAGELTAILGANGCGKTTFLKCLTGIWRPASGSVLVDDRDLASQSPAQRGRLVSLVPQHHHPAFPYLAREIVLMGRAPHLPRLGAPGDRDREIAREALAAVGIDHLAERDYSVMSGGERQLVLIARSLAQQTPVMLLDEPTSHLDFCNQIRVAELLHGLARRHRLAVVITIHDPNLAAAHADQIVMIRAGKVLAAGSVEQTFTGELLSRTYNMEVAVARHPRTWVYAAHRT